MERAVRRSARQGRAVRPYQIPDHRPNPRGPGRPPNADRQGRGRQPDPMQVIAQVGKKKFL